MECNAVIKVRLPLNEVLLETMEQYSESAQHVIDVGYNTSLSKFKLHHATYYAVREISNLPAQLVISSRDKAYEMLKSVRARKRQGKEASKPLCKKFLTVRYDARSFTFKPDEVSLSTIRGRLRVPIRIPGYFLKYLSWTVKAADLIYRKSKLFLHVVVSKYINSADYSGHSIGVDVGINNLAVTSDRRFYKGVKGKLAKFYRLKRVLQAKGTRSARRKLKRVSGRQTRFMACVNHGISKDIAKPLESGDCIVMEDLKGIRKGVTIKGRRRGKALNRLTNNWAFSQLQTFIDYKATRKEVHVVYVSPHYSSKTCSKCGEIHSIRPRRRGFFKCLHCGFSLNSDLNASRNLRDIANAHIRNKSRSEGASLRLKPLANSRGLYVNQPIVADDEGEASSFEGELSVSSVTSLFQNH